MYRYIYIHTCIFVFTYTLRHIKTHSSTGAGIGGIYEPVLVVTVAFAGLFHIKHLDH